MEFTRWMVTLLLLCLVHHLSAVIEAVLFADTCPGWNTTMSCGEAADQDTKVYKASWIFRGAEICSYENGIPKCEHPHFLNRTWFASIRQNNFSLVINDVRLQDQGEYVCLINGAVMQRNRLSVKDSLVCKLHENKNKEVPDENPPGAPSSEWLDSWLVIVGIVVIVGILVIVGLLVNQRRCRSSEGGGTRQGKKCRLDHTSMNSDNLTPPMQ